jgi:hypothetical protein
MREKFTVVLPDWKDVEISFSGVSPKTIQNIINLIFEDSDWYCKTKEYTGWEEFESNKEI